MERLNDYSNSVRGTRSLNLTYALLLESWQGLWLVTWDRHQWHNVVVQSLSRVRLYDPMDCSPPGSSVHGIFQARYWNLSPFWNTRIHFLLQIFLTQRSNWVSYFSDRLFTTEPPGKPNDTLIGNFTTRVDPTSAPLQLRSSMLVLRVSWWSLSHWNSFSPEYLASCSQIAQFVQSSNTQHICTALCFFFPFIADTANQS